MLPELHDLSERWFAAWLNKDAATVERLMAADYIYVGPSGLVLDRQAILRVIRSPSYRLGHRTRSEIIVRGLGDDAAVVRHRSQGAGSFEGTSFTDDHRCVMVMGETCWPVATRDGTVLAQQQVAMPGGDLAGSSPPAEMAGAGITSPSPPH